MHDARADIRDDSYELVLRDLPVGLFLQAHQHADDLVRELFLMVNDSVPAPLELVRMAAIAEAFATVVAPIRNALTARVQSAYGAGVDSLDLRARYPRAAAPAVEAWDSMLEELDGLSRRGILLTVPAPPQVLEFRRWHQAQLVAQLRDGGPVVGWPEWRAASPSHPSVA